MVSVFHSFLCCSFDIKYSMFRILVLCLIGLFIYTYCEAQQNLGVFQSYSLENGKAQIITTKGILTFQMYEGNVLQTSFEAGYARSEQISNAVLSKPIASLQLLKESDASIIFGSANTKVVISKNPVQVTYRSGESTIQWLSADSVEAHRYLQFSLATDEKIFGTGSRSIPLNRRGYRVRLDNNPWYGYNVNAADLNYSIPFFVSTNAYGIFFDNPSRGYLDIGKKDSTLLEAGFSSGKLQFYTFFGSNTGAVVQQFVKMVGTPPIPPRWAFGNFMSRFGYRSQQEVMDIARKMQSEDFPLDAVIIDLFWFGDGEHTRWNMGNLDWNRTRFPTPEKMLDSLRSMKLKTLLITEPFVLSESFNYQETQQKKLNALSSKGDTTHIKEFYFGHAGLLDMAKKDTRDWFWQKYDAQIKKGVDAWWGDLGEPEKHPDYLYHDLTDLGFNRPFNANELHNIYGHWWSEMLFEKYAQHYPNTRLFHLNRSGYAGTWRFGSIPWSGDVERSWDGFRAQLPIMLGMSLSGAPYMHSDAGGFAMGKRDPELYTRWLQMSVFSPIFRPHGSVNAPEPNVPQIESEPVFYEEPYRSILRNTVKLRYRLLPYTYNLARDASLNGSPLARPIFYHDNTDTNLFKAEDQYMFGDALLVAPVLEKDAKQRELYLPKGDWYAFDDGKKQSGGNWLTVPVNMNHIPVFVKAGSIVPMMPAFNHTAEYFQQPLHIYYYPSKQPSRYQLYEDDGISNNVHASGAFEITTIEVAGQRKAIRMNVFSNKGDYSNRPGHRLLNICIPGLQDVPKKIYLNKQPLVVAKEKKEVGTNVHNAYWDAEKSVLIIQLPRFNGDAVTLLIPER